MTQRLPFTMLSICSAISVLCLEQSLQTVVWESLGNVRFKNDYSFDFKIMTFLILYCASNQNIKMYITLIFVLYWSDPGVWSSYEATKAVVLVKRKVQWDRLWKPGCLAFQWQKCSCAFFMCQRRKTSGGAGICSSGKIFEFWDLTFLKVIWKS